MKTDLLTLFLRREPARDGTPGKLDVVAFAENNGKPSPIPKARWAWHHSSRPKKAQKTVKLNCFKWRAVWLDHMGKPEKAGKPT